MRVKRIISVLITAAALLFLGCILFPPASQGNALAPAIFISYDQQGNESRIIFSIEEQSGRSLVNVYDDDHIGASGLRALTDGEFTYDQESGTVAFDGREWKLTGPVGERRLENIASDRGELWGTYYEDEAMARAHPFEG